MPATESIAISNNIREDVKQLMRQFGNQWVQESFSGLPPVMANFIERSVYFT